MAKKSAGRRSKSTGQKIAARLVKPAGPGAIYIGPWMLFRRVAGADDTKHAIGWIRESIADAVDAALAGLLRVKPADVKKLEAKEAGKKKGPKK